MTEGARPDGNVIDVGEGVPFWRDLLTWGELLESLVGSGPQGFGLQDFWTQGTHPGHVRAYLSDLARLFAREGRAGDFTAWWLGLTDDRVFSSDLIQLGEATLGDDLIVERLTELTDLAYRTFCLFFDDWCLTSEGLVDRQDSHFSLEVPLPEDLLLRVKALLGPKQDSVVPPAAGLDGPIARVRAFFEPLESPLFGMTTELLAEHVRQTIPREVPGDDVAPVIPLFGKHHRGHDFSSRLSLPMHLRVLLRRLERAQAAGEVVHELLAFLEVVDFTLRFAAGLALGCQASLMKIEVPLAFDPSTHALIKGLSSAMEGLRSYWDVPEAQPALHLMCHGRELHPYWNWAGLESNLHLLAWMIEAEGAIREDNPGRCSALADEIVDGLSSWLDEVVLLCSAWDVSLATRQDGFLGITVARGAVCVECKPLIDATRYSVWLDRSELSFHAQARSSEAESLGVASLGSGIAICSNDPPYLTQQISEVLRAHEAGEILAMGHALFNGLEYLLRLHVGLACSFLRNHFEEASLLEPVLRAGGPLQHAIYFLSYSQRLLREFPSSEGDLLRSVFFEGEQPRRIASWLGIERGVPGPLQGAMGWSLSLSRPDAAHRVQDVKEEIPIFCSLFAEFAEASRSFWSNAPLQTEILPDGAQVTVCQFPSGLRLRGMPDIIVGHRVKRPMSGIVVGGFVPLDPLVGWEQDEVDMPQETEKEGVMLPREAGQSSESPWPSFFDESVLSKVSLWDERLARELADRVREHTFSGPQRRPRELVKAIVETIGKAPADTSTISLIQGKEGSGRTLLCRTIADPRYSGLPPEFPVLYLKLDRFPQTRLSTVIERLNDHIASETSLERFRWTPVPAEVLQSLGWEVDRLSKELAELGHTSESLACRLSSYLRSLKKVNSGRDFLLILDGLEDVPVALLPKVLPPGVHLLLTGSSFPRVESRSIYLGCRKWDLGRDPSIHAAFRRTLAEIELNDESSASVFSKLEGSQLRAHAYVNIRENLEGYHPSLTVVDDLLAFGRRLFSDSGQREAFQDLLALLGLFERPLGLSALELLGVDAEVANIATSSLPALFSFWSEPEPSLGLSHPYVFRSLQAGGARVSRVAHALWQRFLDAPQASDLMSALRWLSLSPKPAESMEMFFAHPKAISVWREELATLWERGLYFHRVALLDATEGPLLLAIESGAGHLQEELSWLHNARGLSLLKLGLLEDARVDLSQALEGFQEQFASGDMGLISSVGSATNRLSEVAFKAQDLDLAEHLSETALSVLQEGRAIAESPQLQGLMAIALLQKARIGLERQDFPRALQAVEAAKALLDPLVNDRFAVARAEASWLRAEGLAGMGETASVFRELEYAIRELFELGCADMGIQALLLRARIFTKQSRMAEAYADLTRALSLLRYQVFVGRVDLEPLMAYVVARRALVGYGQPNDEARGLSEFVDWARHAIRHEGRSDLRALLAYLLLSRARCWRGAGEFLPAIDDLRLASEQYDLLVGTAASMSLPTERRGLIWSGLRTAYAEMAALYLSLDEAPLALIAGRRALELARRSGRENLVFESGMEVPNLSSVAPTTAMLVEDPFDSELYHVSRLLFHLGEASRRLHLTRAAMAYFEQAAHGFGRIFYTETAPPPDKLAEYRGFLRHVAGVCERQRDYLGLEHWATRLRDLPVLEQPFSDRLAVARWLGKCSAWRGDFERAQTHFKEALTLLEPPQSMGLHGRESSSGQEASTLQEDVLKLELQLELGRALSLHGYHEEALRQLHRGTASVERLLFLDGEDNRELYVRASLHVAVAYLRAGQQRAAVSSLGLLGSVRPRGGAITPEMAQLTEDWMKAWQEGSPLPLADLASYLVQICDLGDWLLRTPLGLWYRELTVTLVGNPNFPQVAWPDGALDRLIETFLIVAFSHSSGVADYRGTPVSDMGELQQLLEAKYEDLKARGLAVEAELVISHLLEYRRTASTGRFLLLRSEMAMERGDRGMGIVDLLRATENRGGAKIQAHLRLAEFLLSRELITASLGHLRRCMFSLTPQVAGRSEILERLSWLLTGLAQAEAQFPPEVLEEYLKVGVAELEAGSPLRLDPTWLRSLGNYRDWPQLTEISLTYLVALQVTGRMRVSDWVFLDAVVECAVLGVGSLPPSTLLQLGELWVRGGVSEGAETLMVRERTWERFQRLLPSLGRGDALEVLERLFDLVPGIRGTSTDGVEVVERLEHERRLLCQPA